MTKEEIAAYKSKLEDLIQEIKNNSECTNKAAVSNKIMSLLENLYIYAMEAYVDEFFESMFVTVDPFEPRVLLEKPDNKDNYIKIKAYSFGPFNAEKYFEKKHRILWLLKEPYCTQKGELTGEIEQIRKQAPSYYKMDWETLKSFPDNGGNPTIANVIKLSSIVLSEIVDDKEGKIKAWNIDIKHGDNEWMREIMDHICILEVNHFPGLKLSDSWKSEDGIIKKWAEINYELIDQLITFYNPQIVIAGGTLEHFLPSNGKGDFSPVKTCINYDNKSLKIFNDLIINWTYIYAGPTEDKKEKDTEVDMPELTLKYNFGKNAKYLSKGSKRIYIQANHPSRGQYSQSMAKKDGERIKNWLKDNG